MALRWLMRKMDQATLRDKSYRFLFEPGPADEVVSVDCETTGLDPRRDEIISVAAIRIRGDRILASETFQAVVRPRVAIAAAAIKVHGLREIDVCNARPMSEILPDLLQFIGGRPLDRLLHRFRHRHAEQSRRGISGNPAAQSAHRSVGDVLRSQIWRCAARHADRPDLRQYPARPEPALVQPARRFFRRADDSDDLREPQGLQGSRHPHRAGRA